MTVLVTGAAGYIGSHTAVELLEAGQRVVGIDDYSNSKPEAIARVQEIAGRQLDAMYDADLRDAAQLDAIFQQHDIDAVIHFAGLKSVAESVEQPLRYFDVNVGSTLSLLSTMTNHGVNKLIFSSSCTVYGDPPLSSMPLDETQAHSPVNPYGQSKAQIESMLVAVCESNPDLAVTALRYFNPIGAHGSGRIGEDPNGTPNSLLPHVMQTAVGLRDAVRVFGADYPTSDGTAIRDYIHVVDVARGHLNALDLDKSGFTAVNLGTGIGSSVLDVISSASKVVGFEIPYLIEPRREGDAVAVFADPTQACVELDWKAEFDLSQMCNDHWRWQKNNPTGYE